MSFLFGIYDILNSLLPIQFHTCGVLWDQYPEMVASTTLLSCNFSSLASLPPNPKTQPLSRKIIISHFSRQNSNQKSQILLVGRRGFSTICGRSKGSQSLDDPDVTEGVSVPGNDRTVNGEGGRDWTTSILLFLFWAAILYYVFNLSPNQTPARDVYFLKKLLNLEADDGFRMNSVLVSLWNIMGLWPIIYSTLLIPTGRSSKGSIPVWPFSVLSFFGGAYALLPYFVLWRPPPPPVEEEQLQRWPLNFLESKITAGVLGAVGLGLIVYAGLATGDWKEFVQYFRESKFIHATSVDFLLLSTFAPFWVYNDMTVRKCYDEYSWLLPLSVIPFLGPSLYIFLRPSLVTTAKSE